MKLLFADIPGHSIEKLVICSLEQALYQPVAVIGGAEFTIWETEQKRLSSRNLTRLRELFAEFDIGETVLRQESAYDEMVGAPPKCASNRLEVPLGKIPLATLA